MLKISFILQRETEHESNQTREMEKKKKRR